MRTSLQLLSRVLLPVPLQGSERKQAKTMQNRLASSAVRQNEKRMPKSEQ
jgi:hypothetical protein